MKTMRDLVAAFRFLPVLVIFVLLPAVANAHPAQDLIKKVTEDLIAALENPKAKNNTKFVREALNDDVLPHIDFKVMTIRSVGKNNWKKAGKDQRQELITEFRQFLLNAYSKTLEEYSGQKMEFLPFEKSDSDKLAVVKTLLRDSGANSAIPVDYKLRNKESWMIYDISVHKSSLVLGYKSEFASEIKKGGIEGLIKALRKKNKGS